MKRASRQYLASARSLPPSQATPLPSDLVNGPIPSFDRRYQVSGPTGIPVAPLQPKVKVRTPPRESRIADPTAQNTAPPLDVLDSQSSDEVGMKYPLGSGVEVRRIRSRSSRLKTKETELVTVVIDTSSVDTALSVEREPLLTDANLNSVIDVQRRVPEATSRVKADVLPQFAQAESTANLDSSPVVPPRFSETDALDLWTGLLGANRPPEEFLRRERSIESTHDDSSGRLHGARFRLPDILFEGDVPGRLHSSSVESGAPMEAELAKGVAGAKLRQWAHSREKLLAERSRQDNPSIAIAGSTPTSTPSSERRLPAGSSPIERSNPISTETPVPTQPPIATFDPSPDAFEDQIKGVGRSLEESHDGVRETALEDLWAPASPSIRMLERDPSTVLVQWDLGPLPSHSEHQKAHGTSSGSPGDGGLESGGNTGLNTGEPYNEFSVAGAHRSDSADGGIPDYRIRVYFDGPGSVAQVEHRIPPATDHHVIRKESGSVPYAAELGYTTHEGRWVCVAGSTHTAEPKFVRVPSPWEENRRHNLPIDAQRSFDEQIGDRFVQSCPSAGEAPSPQGIDRFEHHRVSRAIAVKPHFERMDVVQVGSLVPSGIQAEILRRIVFDTETWGESFESSHWMGHRKLERVESIPPTPADIAPSSADLPRLMEQEVVGISSAVPAGDVDVPDIHTTMGADRSFWFRVNAEVVLYGSTEPDACVTIGGRPVKLRADGSFSFRFILPDGRFVLPVVARSADGVEERSAAVTFSRETQFVGEVGAHPQDPSLHPPAGDLE